MKTSVVERFTRYVKIFTQSDHDSTSFPSTVRQLDLARLLVDELHDLGLVDVFMDASGYVYGTLPANTTAPAPVIGFVAHMDTSPDLTGKNVKPQFVDYTGGDIVLNHEKNIVLSPREFPDLNKYVGKTLITTDGTTLLGADDKAGLAEIMAALEQLAAHSELKHGVIKVGFTPDEEVGHGADRFDIAGFGADFAYTMDGGEVGELQYENFNAAAATITIQGRSVHPGSSKNKMINASLVGIELNNLLPAEKRPDSTEGYEGFFHLTHFDGDVEQAKLKYIIREHDRSIFEAMKANLTGIVDQLNAKYGKRIELDLEDTYYNMKEKIEPVMHVIELARSAMEAVGVTPLVIPIRGGTDGARLSYDGLPCPNIFTGGHNAHGRYEYVPVFAMEKAVEVILQIVQKAVK
ncbi:peptidase T, partial [bacterium]|nr:peptidase T [bacterium]